MMTLMLSQKDPMKKDSEGWKKALRMWAGYRIARAVMQAQRMVKRVRFRKKMIRPIV